VLHRFGGLGGADRVAQIIYKRMADLSRRAWLDIFPE
jgi:hypothetical protein